GAFSPSIDLPAFHKSGCKILRSRRDPTIDNGWRKKSTSLDFAAVDDGITANFSSIKPNKLLLSPCRVRQLQNLFQRNIYPELFFQLAAGRFVVAFAGCYMTRSARVPLQRMSILPAGALLQVNVACLVENQDVDGA